MASTMISYNSSRVCIENVSILIVDPVFGNASCATVSWIAVSWMCRNSPSSFPAGS